jgi:hypothetical protein
MVVPINNEIIAFDPLKKVELSCTSLIASFGEMCQTFARDMHLITCIWNNLILANTAHNNSRKKFQQ